MKSIKLWDGWRITLDGKETVCEGPVDAWKFFGWDIENDPNASECARIITTEMFCFGHIDLSKLCSEPGHTLTIDVIPAREEEEASWKRAEEQ